MSDNQTKSTAGINCRARLEWWNATFTILSGTFKAGVCKVQIVNIYNLTNQVSVTNTQHWVVAWKQEYTICKWMSSKWDSALHLMTPVTKKHILVNILNYFIIFNSYFMSTWRGGQGLGVLGCSLLIVMYHKPINSFYGRSILRI